MQLSQHITKDMVPILRKSKYYKQEIDALVITNTEAMKESNNIAKCKATLDELIVQSAKDVLRDEDRSVGHKENKISQ